MDAAGGRRNQQQEAVRPDEPYHFLEHQPEELRVLQHLTGDHDIGGSVRHGNAVRVGEDMVDPGSGRRVEAYVMEFRMVEDRAVASVGNPPRPCRQP